MSFKYYIRLTRPVNVLITFITAAAAVLIAGNVSTGLSVYLYAAISAALTAGAGNIINDYFDVETDKINRPGRPLAAGKISISGAKIFYGLLVFLSLLPAFFINYTSFITVAAVHAALFIYSARLKKIPFAGNLTIALITGFVFIYGGIAVSNIRNSVIPAIFAFLINLVREILKDAEDIKGDEASSIRTIPIIKGIKFTKRIIFYLTVILIFFTFHPFIFNYYRIEYFVFVMLFVNPLLVYFLRSLYLDHTQKNLDKLSALLKFVMITGLAAIYMGR
jgi:geranylgeranylglycerol-phosphate geranylgeranyltransferase